MTSSPNIQDGGPPRPHVRPRSFQSRRSLAFFSASSFRSRSSSSFFCWASFFSCSALNYSFAFKDDFYARPFLTQKINDMQLLDPLNLSSTFCVFWDPWSLLQYIYVPDFLPLGLLLFEPLELLLPPEYTMTPVLYCMYLISFRLDCFTLSRLSSSSQCTLLPLFWTVCT